MANSRGLLSILVGLGLGVLTVLLWWAFGPQLHGRSPGRLYIIGAVSIAAILWGVFLLAREGAQKRARRAVHASALVGATHLSVQAPPAGDAAAAVGPAGFGRKTTTGPVDPIRPIVSRASATEGRAATLDDLMDLIDQKMVGPVSEKEALTPDEYNILMCMNFDAEMREVGVYEYVYNENEEVLKDVQHALLACGVTEWGYLLTAYITNDSGKYVAFYADETQAFEPSGDYPGMFEVVARDKRITFDQYMRVVLTDFARAKGLISS